MKPWVLASIGLALACTRPIPDAATPDPESRPLDASVPAPAPTPTPTPTPTPVAPVSGPKTCEPTVRCGVWSGCKWLEQIGTDRYREVSGKEIFVRRHECWPADGGLASCAVYCRGGDGGPPCVDGLHPEEETCTGAAIPHPDSRRCSLMDGVCGSLM